MKFNILWIVFFIFVRVNIFNWFVKLVGYIGWILCLLYFILWMIFWCIFCKCGSVFWLSIVFVDINIFCFDNVCVFEIICLYNFNLVFNGGCFFIVLKLIFVNLLVVF